MLLLGGGPIRCYILLAFIDDRKLLETFPQRRSPGRVRQEYLPYHDRRAEAPLRMAGDSTTG